MGNVNDIESFNQSEITFSDHPNNYVGGGGHMQTPDRHASIILWHISHNWSERLSERLQKGLRLLVLTVRHSALLHCRSTQLASITGKLPPVIASSSVGTYQTPYQLWIIIVIEKHYFAAYRIFRTPKKNEYEIGLPNFFCQTFTRPCPVEWLIGQAMYRDSLYLFMILDFLAKYKYLFA